MKFESVAVTGSEHANWRGLDRGIASPGYVSGGIETPMGVSQSGRTDSWTSCTMYKSEGVLGALQTSADASAVGDNCCTDAPQQYDMFENRNCASNTASFDLRTVSGSSLTAAECLHLCTQQSHPHTGKKCNGVTMNSLDWSGRSITGTCVLLEMDWRMHPDVPGRCSLHAATSGYRTYRHNADLATTSCSSGDSLEIAPYFEGILTHRTQITDVHVIPSKQSGANAISKYTVWYRLHPNQSPWTRLGNTRCYPQNNPFGKAEAVAADASSPLTAADAGACRTLTESHSLISGQVPDMYRFDPSRSTENCVPQKLKGATSNPENFEPWLCSQSDGGWETYINDLNFPSDLNRFPPSPPPSRRRLSLPPSMYGGNAPNGKCYVEMDLHWRECWTREDDANGLVPENERGYWTAGPVTTEYDCSEYYQHLIENGVETSFIGFRVENAPDRPVGCSVRRPPDADVNGYYWPYGDAPLTVVWNRWDMHSGAKQSDRWLVCLCEPSPPPRAPSIPLPPPLPQRD